MFLHRDEAPASPLADAFAQITHRPVLSVKEERSLIEQLATASGEQAHAVRTRLIEAMLPLVVRLVSRTRACGIEPADLMQEGSLAVVEAMQTFDPQKNQLFRRFATQ